MMRTSAFAGLCMILATYGVFKLDDAYTTFASDMPDPAGSRQVIHQELDPIGEADAYALSQTAPAAGGRPTTASSRRPVNTPDKDELLQLLSDNGEPRVIHVAPRKQAALPAVPLE